MFNKITGKNSTNRVQAAQEGYRNSIKAHTRYRRRSFPLLNIGKVIQGSRKSRKCTSNCHGKDYVQFFLHAGIFCCILVITGGFQLIAKGSFIQDDIDNNRNYNRKRNSNRNIFIVVEKLTESKAWNYRTRRNSFNLITFRKRHIHYRFPVHKDVYNIQGNPVHHNAGNNFVHIEKSLKASDYGTPQSRSNCCNNNTEPPR